MPRSKEQLLKTVVDGGVIAVIRAPSAEFLIAIAEALLEGGVPAVEVTMSTPKAIRGIEPLPQLRLSRTGGVDVRNAAEWIKAGAVCVGAGSSLVTKDAMAKKDWAAITANAKAFVEAIKAARGMTKPESPN